MLVNSKIDIEALLKSELPTLPGAAMRVASLAQDFNSSTRSIAEAIGADPALAVRVLKAANSPLYAVERQISTLTAAVQTLGNENIHTLVIISSAARVFANRTWRTPLGRALWRHSLAVALAARQVFTTLRLNGKEEAFVCGLLHDIGRMILSLCEDVPYASLLAAEDEQEVLRRECDEFGFTHAQVGALVAKRWNLPEEVSYAIHHHHNPGETQRSVVLARAVDAADALANTKGVGVRAVDPEALGVSESVIALGLTPEQLEQIWKQVEGELSALEALMG